MHICFTKYCYKKYNYSQFFLPSPNSGLGKNKYTERFSIAFLFLGCLSSINGSEPF